MLNSNTMTKIARNKATSEKNYLETARSGTTSYRNNFKNNNKYHECVMESSAQRVK